jgi:predicted RND superfamily exporter protein
MMSVGSLLVVPATLLLAPAVSLFMARDFRAPRSNFGEAQLGAWLVRSLESLQARPLAVLGGLAVVAAICSAGVARLEVETDFTRNFRRGSQVVKSYELVESQLGGAGVMDVIIPAPAVLDAEYVERVRKLEAQLRELEIVDARTRQPTRALTKVLSAVDALDAVAADRTLAALTPTLEMRYQALAAAIPVFMGALRAAGDESGSGRLRIMLRAHERQPAEQKQRLIEEVTRLAREAFPDEAGRPAAEVTGFFVLLTNLIKSILRDQWITFAIASAAIMVMIGLAFRSWKYALIAMIPNAVPIYMVMGLLGWLGLKMNMGAAMIAAVSMGLSVDSSIHYFSGFRRARREGLSVPQALVRCQQRVGLAMVFSTIALIVGFSVLVTSEFVPTIYFGALMSLAMLGGLLGNLIVLPLMLAWLEHD